MSAHVEDRRTFLSPEWYENAAANARLAARNLLAPPFGRLGAYWCVQKARQSTLWAIACSTKAALRRLQEKDGAK